MTVKADLAFSLKLSQTGSAVLGAAPNWAATMLHTKALKNGTAANQYDVQYAAERTISSGATDSIDLAGVLADAMGDTVTAAELVGVAIINQAVDGTPNTTNITVGGGSNAVPGFSSALAPISPGGMLFMLSPGAAGLATVTAGTGDILQIVNGSGAAAKVQVALLMRTA
jgi:hypothetical protein